MKKKSYLIIIASILVLYAGVFNGLRKKLEFDKTDYIILSIGMFIFFISYLIDKLKK